MRPSLHRKKSQLGFAKAADRDAAAVAAAAAAVLAVVPPETWLIPAVQALNGTSADAAQQERNTASSPATLAAGSAADLESTTAFAAAVDAAAAKLSLSLDFELTPDEVSWLFSGFKRRRGHLVELHAATTARNPSLLRSPPQPPFNRLPPPLLPTVPPPAGAVAGAGTCIARVPRTRPLPGTGARAARHHRRPLRQPADRRRPCNQHQESFCLPAGCAAPRPAPAGGRAAPSAGSCRLHGAPRHS